VAKSWKTRTGSSELRTETSDLDALDDEVVRPGRFDRKLQVGLPDAGARRSILAVALTGRPTAPQLDHDAIAARTDGLTAAALLQAVDAAALEAMEASAPVSTVHLVHALGLGGVERPTVDGWTWGGSSSLTRWRPS
jgi:ATP-dependent Zn protease